MVLRFLVLVVFLFSENVLGEKSDLRDFFYAVDLSVKENSSLIEDMADLVSESEIKSEVKKLTVFSEQDKPVSSMTALNDRLNNDMKTIHKNLHILGYYNAKVKYTINITEDNSVTVFIKADAGNKFKLVTDLKFPDQSEKFNEYYASLLKTKFKQTKASMPEIRGVIDETLLLMKNIGFYNPEPTRKKVFINYEEGKATLELRIICGKNVNFGKTEIEAFPGIDEQFIRNRLSWEIGERYNEDKVNSSVNNLKNTQIFSSVKISPKENSPQGDSLSMRVKVEEDKKHMLDLSLMYSGVRNMNFDKKSQAQKGVKSIIAKVMWTRLNAFGGGEKLVFNAEGTPMKTSDKRVDYAFETYLTQPDVFAKNASMEYGISHRQELTNVFFKKTERVNAKYIYPLTDILFANIGFIIENNYVDSDDIFFMHNNSSRYYEDRIIPVSLVLDQTDNFLNPTSGYKVEAKCSWMRLSGAAVNSIKFYSVNYSYNHSLDELKKNILAFRISKKGIFSADIDNVPLDKRLYAGGIHSVRGYANQMAAEMVKGHDVTMGGKSLVEFGTEYRRKINSDWGGTAFFDGAKVYNNQSRYFDIEKKRWFFSLGAGVRYYTSIGPIRIDFAFPLRRRKGIDSKMQFIMGLGQAF